MLDALIFVRSITLIATMSPLRRCVPLYTAPNDPLREAATQYQKSNGNSVSRTLISTLKTHIYFSVGPMTRRRGHPSGALNRRAVRSNTYFPNRSPISYVELTFPSISKYVAASLLNGSSQSEGTRCERRHRHESQKFTQNKWRDIDTIKADTRFTSISTQ